MKLIMVMVILLIAGAGVIYKLYSDNEVLTLLNEGLVQELSVEREKLKFQQEQNELALERLTALERDRKKAEANVQYMRELYNDHNFAKLLSSKPGWMTKKMLKATEVKLNELQIVTAE